MSRSVLFLSDVVVHKVHGGAERVLQEEALGLRKRGYEVGVLHRYARNLRASYHGVRIWGYRFAFSLFSWLNLLRAYKAVEQELSPSVFIGHQPFSSLPLFLKESFRKRVYVYLSSWHLEVKMRRKAGPVELALCRFIESMVLSLADYLMVISHHARDELLRLYPRLKAKKIMVNWLGADLAKFKPALDRAKQREALGIPSSCFLYLSVRNLVPRMGLFRLISAFSLLPEKIQEKSFLLIVGDGPLKQELEQKVEKLKLTKRVAIRNVYGSELLLLPERIIPLADCFVLPTKALENFGLVIPEALACEVPVVGTPVGAIPEVLGMWDRRFLCRSTRPEHIAEKMRWAFEHRESLREAGRRGRACVAVHFSWARHLEKLENLISRCL